MPMIDVHAPADLFPAGSDRALGEGPTLAVLRAVGVPNPGPFHADNTACDLHRMPASAVQTAATALARTVRIQMGGPHTGKRFRIMAIAIRTVQDGRIASTIQLGNWLLGLGQLRAS